MSTTTNRMNFTLQRNDAYLSLKVPREMRNLIKEYASHQNMSDSNYVKLAIQEKLNRETKEY